MPGDVAVPRLGDADRERSGPLEQVRCGRRHDPESARRVSGGVAGRTVRGGGMTSEAPVRSAVEPIETPAVSLDQMLATGVSYRQIDYWCRQGYLKPLTASPGKGAGRVWPA